MTKTIMSVLLIVEPKRTLAASHAVLGESRCVCGRERQTDGQTDGRTSDRYITLSATDAVSLIKRVCKRCLKCYLYIYFQYLVPDMSAN